jgi:hypothetical protein
MEKFLNALEDENFDVAEFFEQAAENAEYFDESSLFPSALSVEEKEELNSKWTSKLDSFLNCKRDCREQKLNDERCNPLAIDFYNFTFSMYGFLFVIRFSDALGFRDCLKTAEICRSFINALK